MSNVIAILILESRIQTEINIGSGSRLERTETSISVKGFLSVLSIRLRYQYRSKIEFY